MNYEIIVFLNTLYNYVGSAIFLCCRINPVHELARHHRTCYFQNHFRSPLVILRSGLKRQILRKINIKLQTEHAKFLKLC